MSACLSSGCASGSAGDSTKLPSGTFLPAETTRPGYDPAAEIATVKEIRDRLVAAGIGCRGEAEAPKKTRNDSFKTGVVAALNCVVDKVSIDIGAYTSKHAKVAGMSNVRMFGCLGGGGKTLEYLDGGSWVVGTRRAGTNFSDPKMTRRISKAIKLPVMVVDCR